MKIYYTVDSPEMISVEFTPEGSDEREYDFFKSMFHLETWILAECGDVTLIEVTDDNYQELRDKGEIS